MTKKQTLEKKPGKGGKARKEKTPLWRMISENIECLAIAIAMALMLNTFFIQAYKIPTGSMQPTLIGCEEQGLFDRVLVNKSIYLFSKPERWDVIVFKYPLNQAKNYIKRLIGLPGEKIDIRNGDIFVDGRIARKPENATGAVLKQLFPEKDGGAPFKRFFKTEGDCRIIDEDGVVFDGPGTVRTVRPIQDGYLDGYDPDYKIPKPRHVTENQYVGDVRLSFEAELLGENGAIRVKITENGKAHVFLLRAKGYPESSSLSTGKLRLDRTNQAADWSDPALLLEKGKKYDLVFSNIDDRLSIRLDGKEVAFHEYDDSVSTRDTSRIEFGPVGCGAAIKEISLHRDIHYLPGRASRDPVIFEVPEGHYFALGDNTQNSSDGRLWQSFYLTQKDGTEIRSNFDGSRESAPRPIGNAYALVDHYGDERMVPFSQLKGVKPQSRFEPYFPEKLLLGKAMVVFWPMIPHFRWKLLR